MDAVQHILAIAERERRKRAQKEQPRQTQPLPTVLGKEGGRKLDTSLTRLSTQPSPGNSSSPSLTNRDWIAPGAR